MSTKGDRDAAVDALLRTPLPGGRGGGACPSPDVLAAFVERSLTLSEREAAEAHLATCERCQEALAALSEMPGLLPVTDQNPRPWWLGLRWLVPAAAVLTMLIVYVAIGPLGGRPAKSPNVATSAAHLNEPVPANSAKSIDAAPSLMARSDAQPSAPAIEPPPPRRETKAEAAQGFGGRPPAKPATGNAPSARSVALTPGPGTTPTSAAAEAGAPAAVAPPATDTLQMKAAAPPAANVSGGMAFRAASPQMAKSAAASAPPLTADAKEQRVGAVAESVAVAAPGRVSVLFLSRDRRSQWRLEPAGGISRSADGGLTWHSAATATLAPLFAGSAPSATTAWVVGAAGTVLRTTDGERWMPSTFPEKVDLIAVDAKDERTATVTATDGRRFTTSDGGTTWKIVQ